MSPAESQEYQQLHIANMLKQHIVETDWLYKQCLQNDPHLRIKQKKSTTNTGVMGLKFSRVV